MKDTSFIDLTKEGNLDKIVIDKRLIPAFIKTMNNFQKYFNKMGYTNTRDYKKYFETHVLNLYYKLLIRCNKKPKINNCSGFYNYQDKKMYIDEEALESTTDVIDILTHEFIHFLVMNYNINKIKEKDNILAYSSINEAMTEMLKLRILPLTHYHYHSQMVMLKYYYLLNDKEINFEDFLNNGEIKDIDYIFAELLCDYDDSLEDRPDFLNDAKKNPKYIKIQRYLLNNYPLKITNLDEYEKLVIKLAKRPIEDIYFMNKYYRFIENILADNLNILDKSIRNRFMLFIKEYRKMIEYLNNNKNTKYVSIFKIDDEEYEIDKKRNIYINNQFYKKGRLIKITEEDKSIEIDLSYSKLKEINKNKINNMNKIKNKKERLKEILKYIIFINNNLNDECIKQYIK